MGFIPSTPGLLLQRHFRKQRAGSAEPTLGKAAATHKAQSRDPHESPGGMSKWGGEGAGSPAPRHGLVVGLRPTVPLGDLEGVSRPRWLNSTT